MAAREEPDTERSLAAFCLGLLDGDERSGVERAVRSDPDLRRRSAAWPTAIAAITCAALVVEGTGAEARLEQRLIQRARIERPPKVRAPRVLRAAGRNMTRLLLIAAIAAAALFGYLAFRPDEPISGRALALSGDGVTGVLLPKYEDRLFALVFWGLPELGPTERWQLWLVRESGAVEPGPFLIRDDEGRATVSIDPNLLETDDALIGFAVSRDDPSERVDGKPSANNIHYQFARY